MRPIVQFNINFVVAHKLEAKPLIEHFHLKKSIKEPFQVFKNESGIRLIISGMGTSRARSAVEYMWQIDQIIKRSYNKKSIIVSLNPEPPAALA